MNCESPGLGLAGAAALAALILYLVSHYLNGIAENWEILALFVGLALIAVEFFVIPGFGVAGISGIIIMIASLVLIMIDNNGFDFEFVRTNDVFTALGVAMKRIVGKHCAHVPAGSKID